MVILQFFNMAAAAILDFINFKFLTVGTVRKVELRRFLPNFVEIARTEAEIFRNFCIFLDGGGRHLGFKNFLICNDRNECFWGTFPPNDVTHRLNPQKNRPWTELRHLRHKQNLRKEGRAEQEISHKRVKFHIFVDKPPLEMSMKNYLVGDVLDGHLRSPNPDHALSGMICHPLIELTTINLPNLKSVSAFCTAYDDIIIVIIFYSPAHKTNENNNRWIEEEYARRLPEKQTLIKLATYLVI